MQIFADYPLLVPVLAWFSSHLWKFIDTSIRDKKITWEAWVASGGMPSSHSALMTALSTTVGILDSFQSISFTITAVLTAIIMHDASGVRQHAGKQAVIINQILKSMFHSKHPLNQLQKLKEVIGHRPVEVIIGGILGIVIAYTTLIVLQ